MSEISLCHRFCNVDFGTYHHLYVSHRGWLADSNMALLAFTNLPKAFRLPWPFGAIRCNSGLVLWGCISINISNHDIRCIPFCLPMVAKSAFLLFQAKWPTSGSCTPDIQAHFADTQSRSISLTMRSGDRLHTFKIKRIRVWNLAAARYTHWFEDLPLIKLDDHDTWIEIAWTIEIDC